jgi:hypothetical protein
MTNPRAFYLAYLLTLKSETTKTPKSKNYRICMFDQVSECNLLSCQPVLNTPEATRPQ